MIESVGRWQILALTVFLRPATLRRKTRIPKTSFQIIQQFTDAKAGLQQQNHLIGANSHLRAQRNHLGDRALQRLFLRQWNRLR
jgi:hypothetical protein